MAQDRSKSNEARESAQVLRFRLRGRSGERPPPGSANEPNDRASEPPDDLAQYEQEDDNDNYRRRMLMNVIAVAVVAMLVGVGVWIADTIAEMDRDQDCVMQGRQNCAPIEIPAAELFRHLSRHRDRNFARRSRR
ncbi:MAG: hypothetical protein ABSC37_17940 [Xanthobacteraceae bacterium]